jgi:putative membrane protein
MGAPPAASFWREALALRGSATPRVALSVAAFGLLAAAVTLAAEWTEARFGVGLALAVAPYEIAGAAIGLLLVLRTNAGYDRWWEARKLWGGIVNQTRNLVISALAYGPRDPEWRARLVRWTAAFPRAACALLRGEPPPPGLAELFGPGAAPVHGPARVARELAALLKEARDRHALDDYAFLRIDRERALLIDHVGACERILRTPLPRVYAIKVRRLIFLFLLTLPFALLHRVGTDWIVPLVTMLVAYSFLSLDRIGAELQNPFSTASISHLPLDEIAASIERTLAGLLKEEERACPRA